MQNSTTEREGRWDDALEECKASTSALGVALDLLHLLAEVANLLLAETADARERLRSSGRSSA
jgi:hypothetical protein